MSAAKKQNNARTFLFSSESVNEGHPDKLCDQVSDAVLDACLKEYPRCKVACESASKDNMAADTELPSLLKPRKNGLCSTVHAAHKAYELPSRNPVYITCRQNANEDMTQERSPIVIKASEASTPAEPLVLDHGEEGWWTLAYLKALRASSSPKEENKFECDPKFETSSSDSESTTMEMLLSEPGLCIDWIDRLKDRLDSTGHSLKTPLSEININDLVDDLEELGLLLWQALDVMRQCSTIEECIEMIHEQGWDQE